MMIHHNKFFASLITFCGVLTAFGIVYAQARPNASIVLKKQSAGFFELTIRDPEGIKEFSLRPEGKSPYGGEVQCPPTYSGKNVVFDAADDFSPPMKAYVIDCAGNQTDFEIAAPDAQGFARGKIPASEPSPTKPELSAPKPPALPTKAPAADQAGASSYGEIAPVPKKSLLDVAYPIKELGNCKDQDSCISYCDDDTHINECLAFAKKNNLLSEEEVKKADKFAELGNKGPGACTSRKSCEAYCSNISHMDECLEWGEKNGFIPDAELAEAKKIQAAVRGGAKLPGGCESKQRCEAICSEPAHIDECLAFAESSGILPPEELAEARKVSEFIKRGETPGGCRTKAQCEKYCEEGDHINECIAFAEKTGLASPEEIEMFKKTGGKGPDGCKGKVQCEAYCNDPEHQEACFTWAQENGLMKGEDLARMREGAERFKEEFEKMPPEVAECLKGAVGEETLNKMLSGKPVFAKDMGEKMQACFQKAFESFGGEFGGPGGGPGGPEGEHGGGFPGGFSGPGGCSNPEECFKFCSEHAEECKGFGPPGGGAGGADGFPGGAPGGFPGGGNTGGEFPGGPGGCRSKEECQAYCEANPKECQNFVMPGAGIRRGEHGEAGPGGCKTFEDCQSFCKQNPEDEKCKGSPDNYFNDYQSGVPVPPSEGGDQHQQQFDQQYKQQLQQQYQQQYQEQYQKQHEQQSGGQIPASGTDNAAVDCTKKGGVWIDDKVLGSYCHSPTAGEQQQVERQQRNTTICPAMPTVDTCPSGQKKVTAFSSPECGTYYTCVSETTSDGGMMPMPSGHEPSPTSPTTGRSFQNFFGVVLSPLLPFR